MRSINNVLLDVTHDTARSGWTNSCWWMLLLLFLYNSYTSVIPEEKNNGKNLFYATKLTKIKTKTSRKAIQMRNRIIEKNINKNTKTSNIQLQGAKLLWYGKMIQKLLNKSVQSRNIWSCNNNPLPLHLCFDLWCPYNGFLYQNLFVCQNTLPHCLQSFLSNYSNCKYSIFN